MYAEIYWLTAEEGGRKTPLMPSRMTRKVYCATTQVKNGNAWSICVRFDNDNDVLPGTTGKYEIEFYSPEAAKQYKSGDVLLIHEGSRVVARGVIL